MDTTDMKKLEMEEEDEEEDEEEEILGGIFEVEGSQSDPTINSLARFAVDQHSKKENAIVEFVKVVNAKIQDVAGVLYYITLEAKVGEKVNVYEAKILEQGWRDLKELIEFKLVGDAPSVDSVKSNCDMSPIQVETTCANVIEDPNGTSEIMRPQDLSKRVRKKPLRMNDYVCYKGSF
ncbi:unnamed protein product [Trifolium pratense]|uniref:Uncharacterized protein n=1 Tax=Trifolium pratense TaxID=57577 RepID=A0ACB0J571_TRIPR|nr:unnamed protein product [Trifolium pratense]